MQLPPPPLPPPPGWPPPPPPPPPGAADPVPPKRRDRKLAVLASAVALVLITAAAGIVAKVQDDAGPPHPDSWDPRVADIAAFVEKARGLTFAHPVYVDFLTKAEYTDVATADEADLSDEDRKLYDRQVGELRALGLAKGDLDLADAVNTVTDSGTLAFYRSTDERVRVRGTDITPGLRVTLAHELTHALQDQHFDIDRLYDVDGDQEASALRALLEGDAVRIENAYVEEELTAVERKAYQEESTGAVESSKESLDDVPAAINASFAAPYFLGEPFVLTIAADGGNAAVDRAMAHPPTTEEQLMSPLQFIDGDGPTDVEPVTLAKGDKMIEESDFGALSWYLTLGERIDPRVALTAADGWGGDASTTFTRKGATCVRAVFVGDEASDEVEMGVALDLWVAAMPGNAKRIDDDGRTGFESCDPGAKADYPVAGRSLTLLNLPTLRSVLVAGSIGPAGRPFAVCYGDALLAKLTNDELLDPDGKIFNDPRLATIAAEAAQSCR